MKKAAFLLIVLLLSCVFIPEISAQNSPTIPLPNINLSVGSSDKPQDLSVTLQILLLMTILTLAPSIIIMTTGYLRIIISFHFLRSALGTMQMPPNQLLSGIALFVTFFVMAPTWNQVYDTSFKPMMDGTMPADSALTNGLKPIREFMYNNVREEDVELFVSLSGSERPATRDELPTLTLIPAFVLSELRAAFIIGFFLFIPFLVIDMIVSSVLMAMGMMMLPPMMISLPFKILLFVLVDGWTLVIGSLVRSFA